MERLTIVPADGSAPIKLFDEERGNGRLTTRDIFQVSPGGAYLAYVSERTIHVRTKNGDDHELPYHEGGALIRFSPNGKYVATLAGSRNANRPDERVIITELATNKSHDVLAGTVSQLEWVKDGLVAVTHGKVWKQTLIHVTVDGTTSTLLDVPDQVTRFVAARDGTRVVAFLSDAGKVRIVALDVAAPKEQHELAVLGDAYVDNADASPDGQRVAYTTDRGLFTIDGNGKPRLVSSRTNIHSLWFAADGRLGYAGPAMATVLDGRRAVQLETGADIRMLRFDPMSTHALVASAGATTDWDPSKKKKSSTQLDGKKGEAVLGADRFAGGLVLWTTAANQADDRRR